ncbi:hypothetical protein [Sphingobacterium yanglingense]|uniref:Uncharacterized protein n=1 Tax=Sphingobacterium yanglingense TaxID=1437280 RepID=A0A4R6WNA3_9SPHI|nr:hypothetical protein [Sphingobacterium yanglingense]TDQ79581.1 hypothetical protein CLV99_1026 [Sphingobacterium yanglingense]
MAAGEVKTKKEDTTAQGAGSTSVDEIIQTSKTDAPTIDESIKSDVDTSNEAPQWALDLIESNNAVIESNNAVVLAVESFNENASRVVREVLEEARLVGSTKPVNTAKPKAEITINKKATYVVAKGKKFQSSVSGNIVEEGTELNGLETERLRSLIAQGIAVEKSED